MKKLIGFIGTTIGGYLGWYLGAPFGFMTGFFAMVIGTAAGLYLSNRLFDNYLS